MKFFHFIFLLATVHFGYSQNTTEPALIPGHLKDSVIVEIQLSKTINESRMGLWKNGDYDIYIEIKPLEESLRKDSEDLHKALKKLNSYDSLNLKLYKLSAERYLMAANQLKEAQNCFDLKKLVLYVGNNIEEQNKGNSFVVNEYIKTMVTQGNASVFYKGERINSLRKRTDSNLTMSIIRIYKDQISNCAYTYYGYINW